MKAELYRIDKQSFINKIQPQINHWSELYSKAIGSVKRTTASLRNKASIPGKLRCKTKEIEEMSSSNPALVTTANRLLKNQDEFAQ
jgi:hypothetical protein